MTHRCDYCDSTDVRVVSYGWGPVPPSYACEQCFLQPQAWGEPDWSDHPRPTMEDTDNVT